MVCVFACVCVCACMYVPVTLYTHTKQTHRYQWLSLWMPFSLQTLWSAFSLQPLISILHIFSLFLFVTAAVFTLSFDLCLFDHSFIPNLPHPSRVYSFILPRYLPTCSYLHSLTNPLLLSCLSICPKTGHIPTWHQVYLTSLYPQQSSIKR